MSLMTEVIVINIQIHPAFVEFCKSIDDYIKEEIDTNLYGYFSEFTLLSFLRQPLQGLLIDFK